MRQVFQPQPFAERKVKRTHSELERDANFWRTVHVLLLFDFPRADPAL